MPALPPKPSRPFVFINVATTADGKLAPAHRHFIPFGSRRDQRLLMELRTGADAVMAGARTVDMARVDLGPGSLRHRRQRLRNGLAEFNLRVIVSGSGSLNPQAEIFRHRFSPIIVLTTERISQHNLKRLRRVADRVELFGSTELDMAAALAWLRQEWGVRRLLCEGGGEVNDALFRAGVVDELYLTFSPLIFGGRDAPTLCDGAGVQDLRHATRLRLKSLQRVGSELFLVYRVRRLGGRTPR